MEIFENIWKHPRTSATGLLLGVVTVAGALSQQGVGLGHVGSGTVVSLVSGLATALLGLLAQDPGSGASAAGSTAKLGVWMLIALLVPLPWMTGCSTAKVAQEIVNWTPALNAAVETVAGTVAVLDPADAVVLAAATKGFEAASKVLDAEARAYLANPGASRLARLQTAVVTLEQQVNQGLLEAARIVNPTSQQQALNEINAVGTAVLAILALVQSVSSGNQVARMAGEAPLKLASVEGWMNRGEAVGLVARHYGLRGEEARAEVSRVEESERAAGF